jgi:hypothetical protein
MIAQGCRCFDSASQNRDFPGKLASTASCTALKKHDAEPLFQIGHLLAEGRLRDMDERRPHGKTLSASAAPCSFIAPIRSGDGSVQEQLGFTDLLKRLRGARSPPVTT